MAVGLTITDNGAGLAFIRAIKPGSQMARTEGVEVGDHIEKIDDAPMVGHRHLDVALRLRQIPPGQTFCLRLISPEKSPLGTHPPKSLGTVLGFSLYIYIGKFIIFRYQFYGFP